jgi:hypothetical protein
MGYMLWSYSGVQQWSTMGYMLVVPLKIGIVLCAHNLISPIPPMQYGFIETPLMTACFKGDVAIVELLLKAGADGDTKSTNYVRG